MKAIILSRQELSRKPPRDFNDKDVLRVGKYMIFIKQGDWGTNVNTYAESDDAPFVALSYAKMPLYLRRFVFER